MKLHFTMPGAQSPEGYMAIELSSYVAGEGPLREFVSGTIEEIVFDEHCLTLLDHGEVMLLLKLCDEVLVLGGQIHVVVPDLAQVTNNTNLTPTDFARIAFGVRYKHRSFWTVSSLANVLRQIGLAVSDSSHFFDAAKWLFDVACLTGTKSAIGESYKPRSQRTKKGHLPADDC